MVTPTIVTSRIILYLTFIGLSGMLDTEPKTSMTSLHGPQRATDTIGATGRGGRKVLKPEWENGYRKTEPQKRLPSK
jgi:hypothetical protein